MLVMMLEVRKARNRDTAASQSLRAQNCVSFFSACKPNPNLKKTARHRVALGMNRVGAWSSTIAIFNMHLARVCLNLLRLYLRRSPGDQGGK